MINRPEIPPLNLAGIGNDSAHPVDTFMDDADAGRVVNIPVESIIPNPDQPRSYFDPEELRDLTTSVRQHADFLNWSVLDAGAFDYAADAWGYTYGAAIEWTQSWWTVRGGGFDLSEVPNSKYLDNSFGQFSLIAELEERHELFGHPGKLKVLGFVNRGRMADYSDAVQRAQQTGTPDVALVRHYNSRPGGALNLEQEIASGFGGFARISGNDGSKEAYEFTEINESVSAGLVLNGDRWHRANDTVGLAGVVNWLSGDARTYFAAGGLGILIGDGRLNYGTEKILEVYYSAAIVDHLTLGVDYQCIDNPAYNRDRGPVSVFGVRVHAEV